MLNTMTSYNTSDEESHYSSKNICISEKLNLSEEENGYDNNKKKILKKYKNTVEKDMQEDDENEDEEGKEENISFDGKSENNIMHNDLDESSFLDSVEDIIWSDKETEDAEKKKKQSVNEEILTKPENESITFSNEEILTKPENESITFSNEEDGKMENDFSNLIYEDKSSENEKDQQADISEELEFEKSSHISERSQKEETQMKYTEEECYIKEIKNQEIEANNNKQITKISEDKENINKETKQPTQTEKKRNSEENNLFDIDVKDKNEWIQKYRNLISTFRKLDKEINRIVNTEYIEVAIKQSIKQYKDFLENDYKDWSFSSQKTMSDFQKNIGARVSEQNEKEYFILSKSISENLKEKTNEEKKINLTLYIFILKYDISIDESARLYLEYSYNSSNLADKNMQNAIQKIIETNECIHNTGGKTGNWNDDDHNYFLKVYENNKTLNNEILIDILQKGIKRNAEEINEHIYWYHKFLNYQNVKNKYINTINIISGNKKNKSKEEEDKKNKIKEWKEKKRNEVKTKQKEKEQMKKEELNLQKKIRESNLRKKQMLEEHYTSKEKEKKKKELEGKQKSVVSEEMLQRINERNERYMQKKIQINSQHNEDNNDKDKKGKQKYTHVQSKLISNTDDILKRLESTVDTIKNIL